MDRITHYFLLHLGKYLAVDCQLMDKQVNLIWSTVCKNSILQELQVNFRSITLPLLCLPFPDAANEYLFEVN